MYVCRNCHIMVSNVSRTIMYVVCCNNGSTTEFHQKEVIKHCTQKNSLHSAAIITLIFTSLQKYRMSCSTGKLNVRNYFRSQFPSFKQLMSLYTIYITSFKCHKNDTFDNICIHTGTFSKNFFSQGAVIQVFLCLFHQFLY